MATQLTRAEFLDVLAQSHLLDPERVRQFVAGEPADLGADGLAARLTAAGLVTKLQAGSLLAGRTRGYFVGPYKLLDPLGKGTSGQVYLAEHTRMRRRVALKVLQSDKMRDTEAVKRFEREAMAAAALRHRNIVHAYDFSRDQHMHYLVMEYVEGRNLLVVLAEDGRVGPVAAAKLMRQAADGLHFAHRRGVVHRDVKPSNLMVSADGRLTLLDLGLARYDGDDEALTRGGAVLGVAAYIAPEQVADSHSVDGRADVYSLGASFWLAVTGKKPPVYGRFDPPPPRTPLEADEYRAILAVIQKAMALDPAKRYQSANELAEALSAVAGERQVATTPAPVGSRVPGQSSTTTPKLESPQPGGRSSGKHSILDEADDEHDECILAAPVKPKSAERTAPLNRPNPNPVVTYTPPPVAETPRPAPPPPSPMKQSNPFRFGDPNPPARRSSMVVTPSARTPAKGGLRWWVWAVAGVVGLVIGLAAAFLTRG